MFKLLFGGPWAWLVSADKDYVECTGDLLDADPVETLRKHLKSPDKRVALRFLNAISWAHPSIVRELIPDLFPWACDQETYSGFARHVIVGLRPSYRDAELEPLIAAELNKLTPDRCDEIRGLIWLLDDLRRDDVLAELKARLLASSDEDLLDIAEDIDDPPATV